MTHEEALKKLKDRLVDDVKDLETDIIRNNGKRDAYTRVIELIDSLFATIKLENEVENDKTKH